MRRAGWCLLACLSLVLVAVLYAMLQRSSPGVLSAWLRPVPRTPASIHNTWSLSSQLMAAESLEDSAASPVADDVMVDVDHLPVAAYDCEALEIVLRAPPGGTVAAWRVAEQGLPVEIEQREDDTVMALHLPTIPIGLGHLHVIDEQGRTVKRIVLMRPGYNLRLGRDERGLLRSGEDPVVLVLARREAQADRRWALLRRLFRKAPEPCTVVLEAPATDWGQSPLLAQISALDRLPVAGQGVVVKVDGNDVEVGWKHRDYRKVLAWLVEDLRRRGVRRVVLVEPVAVMDDGESLQALREQVVDVARSYRIEMIAQPGLGDHRYWQISPGIIGRRLNAAGQDLYRSRYRPVMQAGR